MASNDGTNGIKQFAYCVSSQLQIQHNFLSQAWNNTFRTSDMLSITSTRHFLRIRNYTRLVWYSNYKKANWEGLKESPKTIPWDLCFVQNDVDASLNNWCDLFLAAVDDHVPKTKHRNVHDYPWIDSELLSLIRKKNKQRVKARASGLLSDKLSFNNLWRVTKQLI